MRKSHDYDVAVVGASIAGCTAAIFFARNGLRVALIERNSKVDSYKRLCTHFILSSAVPTIEQLGLAEVIERAGAIRNGAEFWTRWGWIRVADAIEAPRPYGYNVRREKLDPLLRSMAINTQGVDYVAGTHVESLREEGGRVSGVRLKNSRGVEGELGARLIVGADGRHSTVARTSGLPCVAKLNNRFAVWTYFRDIPLATGNTSQVWFLEPDACYAFPNDDGITLLGCMPHKSRVAEFKGDLEGQFRRFYAALPDGPEIGGGKRASSFFMVLDSPNISRRPVKPGLALIGDAVLASDPLWGVGCGWAFQSARWLVEKSAQALNDGNPKLVDEALEHYRAAHESAFAAHHSVICDFSTRSKFNLLERLFFSASVHDPKTARHFDAFGNRRISVREFLSSRAVMRAASVVTTHALGFAPKTDRRKLDQKSTV